MSAAPIQLPPLVEQVRAHLPPGQAYLVGGAVRDLLLGRAPHDFDFVVAAKAIPLGRKLANALGGDFYPLDSERDAGRILLAQDGRRVVIDLVAQQGAEIEADLRGRDFTLNAMALSLAEPIALIDPLGGSADLRAKRLRITGALAFANDPVRILRAVRLAAAFGLQLEPETRAALRAAVPGLASVSSERLRDEFFRLLEAPKPAAALRALDVLGGLDPLLPELAPLKGLAQSLPHIYDVWNHSLHVVDKLDLVFAALDESYPAEGAGDLVSGLTVLRLGRYRSPVSAHLAAELVPGRPRRTLLLLAALLHDCGKALTRSVDADGRIRFFEHEARGAELVQARAEALRLSSDECELLRVVVANHMRPFLLSQTGEVPSRRAIYRYFRDTGAAGVDVCLLSLADLLGKNGAELAEAELTRRLDTLRALLEGYYERAEQVVSPPVLLDGDDLMRELGLKPGRKVGELLEALREAQAMGKVEDRTAALAFARSLVKSGPN